MPLTITRHLLVLGLATLSMGAAAGGQVRGLAAGLLGAGAGGGIRGAVIGGLGAATGGDLTGLAIGGLGVGSGGTLRGLAVAGLGLGAPRIHGTAIAPAIRATDIWTPFSLSALMRQTSGGTFSGFSVSGVHAMRGTQQGLVLGLVNYASTLDGVQVGVINIARNARVKVTPLFNLAHAR